MAGGRPTLLTDEIRTEILNRIVCGESLSSICRSEHLPARSTVLLWVASDKDGFLDSYNKACEARCYGLADDLIDIADDGSNDWMENNDPDNPGYKQNGEAVNRSRLRVDSRKWILSKLLKVFSDKKDTTMVNHVSNIMPVPTADSADSWEEIARKQQGTILNDKK